MNGGTLPEKKFSTLASQMIAFHQDGHDLITQYRCRFQDRFEAVYNKARSLNGISWERTFYQEAEEACLGIFYFGYPRKTSEWLEQNGILPTTGSITGLITSLVMLHIATMFQEEFAKIRQDGKRGEMWTSIRELAQREVEKRVQVPENWSPLSLVA